MGWLDEDEWSVSSSSTSSSLSKAVQDWDKLDLRLWAAVGSAGARGGRHGQRGDSESDALWGAVTCVCLFSFTSFVEGVLYLLHCVPIDDGVGGTNRVLYYAGSVHCYLGWQLPAILLLLLLLALPLWVSVVWAMASLGDDDSGSDNLGTTSTTSWMGWSEVSDSRQQYRSRSISADLLAGVRSKSQELRAGARRQRWPQHPVLQAFKHHATEPFRDECWHWTAMLMLQRLCTVACQSLSTQPLTSVLGVTGVSFAFVLLQLITSPYRQLWVNRLQLLAATCLTLISALNVALAALISAGVEVTRIGPLKGVTFNIYAIMLVLLVHTRPTGCAYCRP